MGRARWTDLVMIREEIEEVPEEAIRERARQAVAWIMAALALVLGAAIGDGHISHVRETAAMEIGRSGR